MGRNEGSEAAGHTGAAEDAAVVPAPPHALSPDGVAEQAAAAPGAAPAAKRPPGGATDPPPDSEASRFAGWRLSRGQAGAAPPRRRRHRVLRWLALAAVLLALFPLAQVLVLRVVPPPPTLLMLERVAQGQGLDRSWRPLGLIAPSLSTAVIAGEDARFCEHHGFDWEAIRRAEAHNARSTRTVRGGSTLSQQTAKNVFLWPARDYLRKGLEAGYTVLIEALWGKRRILEVYLNEVEWGPGTYGAQAAARRYFGEDAADLTPEQSARLAAILPSPLKWRAVNPGRYVARRSRAIGANARVVREDDLAWCLRRR